MSEYLQEMAPSRAHAPGGAIGGYHSRRAATTGYRHDGWHFRPTPAAKPWRLLRISQGGADTHVDPQRHGEVGYSLHYLRGECRSHVQLVIRCFEHQLVVDLE